MGIIFLELFQKLDRDLQHYQPHPGVVEQCEELGHQEASPLDGEVAEERLDVLEGTGCNLSGVEKKIGIFCYLICIFTL